VPELESVVYCIWTWPPSFKAIFNETYKNVISYLEKKIMLRPFQIIICSPQISPIKLFAHFTSLQSDQDSWGNLKAMGRMIKKSAFLCSLLFVLHLRHSFIVIMALRQRETQGDEQELRLLSVYLLYAVTIHTYCC